MSCPFIHIGLKKWEMYCGETRYCYNAEVYKNEATSSNSEKDMNGSDMSIILNKIAIIDKP